MTFSVLTAATMALAVPVAASFQANEPLPPFNAAIPETRDAAYPGTLRLEVDATDTAHRVFHIVETIPVARPGRLTLLYPQWLPGTHGPTGQIEAVAGLRIRAGGRPLAWRRDSRNMFAFHVDVPQGADSIEVAFDYVPTSTGGYDNRVVMSREMLSLQWERVALYPAGYSVRRIPIRPAVTLPEGWTGISALDGAPRRGRIAYEAVDFDTMVDSPMFAGRNFRSWNLGPGADLNAFADRPEDLAATDAQIAAHRRLVEQAVKAFGGRRFDRYDFLLALSAELDGIGLEHHRSSENILARDYFTNWANLGDARTLLPHELAHSWNGKFRRPAGLWSLDYHTPTGNDLLWVYEGQTQFWQFVLAARSGMTTRELALGEIASIAAYAQLQPGRAWRPLLDTTYEPIIGNHRGQAYPSFQRDTDYYNEGALIWLDVDSLIREQSNGRKSIDDFARLFFGIRNGDWNPVTYTFENVVQTLNAVTPFDWAAFLRARVEQVSPPQLDGIRRGGYRLVWRPEPNAFDAGQMTQSQNLNLIHSIGAVVGRDGSVSNVIWDGPLFAQGVRSGATIVAVNGHEYSDDELKSAITAATAARDPIQLLLKEGARYRIVPLDYHQGLRWPHLERIGTRPSRLDALLTPLP